MKLLKINTLLCVLCGTTAITLAGGYHAFSLLIILLSCFFGFYKDGMLIPRFLRKDIFLNTVILIYALIFIIDTIITKDPVSSLTRLLTFLLIIKILNIKEWKDCLLIVLLAFVQLTVSASLTTDLPFIIPLLLFLFFSMSALISITYQDSPGIYKLSIRYFFSVSLLGFLFFFIIPHHGTGYFSVRSRSVEKETGFSERVDLGDIGKAKRNSKIVMRIELPFTFLRGEYLRYRGMVFDKYDGLSWRKEKGDFIKLRRRGDEIVLRKDFVPARKKLKQVISLEPIDTTSMFFAGEPLKIYTFDFRRIFMDRYGDLSFSFQRKRRVRYEVVSTLPFYRIEDLTQADWTNFPEEIKNIYLSLPPIDKEIENLALEFMEAAENQYELCEAIELYLTRSYRYSLDTSGINPSNPLRSFLIEKEGGDCEFFATSMAVMLRILGIPSRVVGGYLGGEHSFFSGRYIVRQSDAHLWVEVYFNGVGWVTFDPTPPEYVDLNSRSLLSYFSSWRDFLELSWDTYIISLDLQDQTSFFGRFVEFSYLTYAKGKQAGRQAIFIIQKMVGERVLPSLRGIGLIAFLVLFMFSSVLALFLFIRNVRKKERSENICQIDFYRRFLSLMKKRGFKKEPWQTPKEFEKDLSRKLLQSTSPVRELFLDDVSVLTDLYYNIRFGNRSIRESEKKELSRRFRSLKRFARSHFD